MEEVKPKKRKSRVRNICLISSRLPSELWDKEVNLLRQFLIELHPSVHIYVGFGDTDFVRDISELCLVTERKCTIFTYSQVEFQIKYFTKECDLLIALWDGVDKEVRAFIRKFYFKKKPVKVKVFDTSREQVSLKDMSKQDLYKLLKVRTGFDFS